MVKEHISIKQVGIWQCLLPVINNLKSYKGYTLAPRKDVEGYQTTIRKILGMVGLIYLL